jgi:D-serine deaminase-like pyridoxal phosphate-dependent protein
MTARILPAAIDTPELVVDRDRMYANVLGLQRTLDERGIRLRPHAKTHKSVRIGRLQVEAGAAGLTVGTLGEAEVFALAGLRDIFVAYPVWPVGAKAERVRALHGSADLRIGIDSAAGAEHLGAAVKGMSRRLRVLVEIDPGLHRTGVPDPEAAVRVARAAKAAGLHVEGVFAHAGHSYAPGRAGAASLDEVSTLEAAAAALEADGFEVETISAGSTPTRTLSGTGRVNEIRAGTYVLGDRQQVVLGAMEPDETAAVVVATVVSAAGDRFVLDAGAKALTKDRPDWVTGFGEVEDYPDVVIEKLSDYHGVTRVPPLARRPGIGELVAIVPNHICPVVDLVSSFTVVAPDGRTERWPVDARGRSG